MKVIVGLMSIFLCTLLFGCTDSEQEPSGPAQQSVTEQGGTQAEVSTPAEPVAESNQGDETISVDTTPGNPEAVPEGTETPGEQPSPESETARTGQPDSELTPAEDTTNTRVLSFWEQRESDYILPEDVNIGPLSGGESAGYTVASGFLQAWINGYYRSADVVTRSRERLANVLEINRSEIQLTSYRIGNFSGTDNDFFQRANIAVLGEPGRAFGEIFLEKVNNRWFISDIQLDTTLLGQEYVKPQEKYEPEVYRLLGVY